MMTGVVIRNQAVTNFFEKVIIQVGGFIAIVEGGKDERKSGVS